ncbi:MAG: glycosyltransferase family 4 protein [Candidatus Sumerlaeia bacterium]|nr:glycosyltransferase family 4 protein [Candidatus Sumerlaeia bacterium]
MPKSTTSNHLLLLLRGFHSDGPGWQVLDTLKALETGTLRVSVVALDWEGSLREPLGEEVTRLGGEFAILPTGWGGVPKTARQIADLDWYSSVTHLCSHLLRPDMVGRILSRRTGRPLLAVEHGLHAWGDKGALLRPLIGMLYRRTLHKGVWIGAVSEKVRRQLIRAGFSRRRILSIPNGVDLCRFPLVTAGERETARNELSFGPTEIILLGVGGLTHNKAWDVAIRAMEALDAKYRLVIAGEGPARRPLLDVARREGVLDRVDLPGSQDKIERHYAAADILLHPSPQESYGRAVVEALSRGLPVIVRAGSGTDRIVPPWPLAAVVEGTSQDNWAAVIKSLGDAQNEGVPPQRSKFVHQHHDSRKTARALLDAIEVMSAGGKKKSRKERQ